MFVLIKETISKVQSWRVVHLCYRKTTKQPIKNTLIGMLIRKVPTPGEGYIKPILRGERDYIEKQWPTRYVWSPDWW